MKKSLLALAVLGAFAGAASAQTSVTVYGVVDLGFQHDNNGVNTTNSIDSGIQSGSRLGFKGTEDLGGGLSASFQLESGINVDTGGYGQGNTAFGRQAWGGLNGSFGSVKLGRQYTPLFNAVDTIDPFGTGLAGDASRLFHTAGTRMNNTINWSAPAMSGFSAEVAYGFGETAGNNSNNSHWGLGVGYANGPIGVNFAYDKMDLASAADAKTWFLGGTYNFGPATGHLAYAANKTDTNAGVDVLDTRDWLIGVSAPLGAGNIMASYIRKNDKLFNNADANQFALGYTYALSKRTNLYTSYSRTSNDSGAAYNAGAAGENDSLFNVGIRHKF